MKMKVRKMTTKDMKVRDTRRITKQSGSFVIRKFHIILLDIILC